MDIDQKVRYYKRLYDHPSGLSLCDLYDIARDLDVTFFKGDFSEMFCCKGRDRKSQE